MHTRAAILVVFLGLAVGGVYLLKNYNNSEHFDQLSIAKNLINDGKFAEGLSVYDELSKKGIATATYAVAQIYSEGWGVSKDQGKAEEYLNIYITQKEELCNTVPNIAVAFQLMARDHTDPEIKEMWRKKALDAGYDDAQCSQSYALPIRREK